MDRLYRGYPWCIHSSNEVFISMTPKQKDDLKVWAAGTLSGILFCILLVLVVKGAEWLGVLAIFLLGMIVGFIWGFGSGKAPWM